jgi:uncharacterized phiE125 gp8 family phage protein
MTLSETTEVPQAALPVARLRDQLRLGRGFPDDAVQDDLLTGFLRAALAAIEGRTAKALLSRSFTLTVSAWREPSRQPLPLAPVTALASVTLLDRTGGQTAISLAGLHLDADAMRPALCGALPMIPAGGSARIAFTAGFGPAWDKVPPDLAQAVLMLAAHYHEHRHDTALDGGCMPFGVAALIERHRPLRLGASA